MTLTEMKQKLATLVAQARTFLDAKDMDSYNKVDAEIDTLSAQIKGIEKQNEREAMLAAIPSAKVTPSPENVRAVNITATPEYTNAFLNSIRGETLTAEERKTLRNAMVIGDDTAGGFLVVPETLETTIREILGSTVSMRKLATVIKVTGDKKTAIATNFGAAEWIGENGAYPKVDDTYAVKTLGSNKLGKIILVSEELLNDSQFDIATLIAKSFGRVFAEGEETAFISGDGTNKPTGVLVDAETGVTTASATAITSDEVIDLYYSLKSGYRANATFLMNDATEKYLRKLKNTTTGDYLWQPGLTSGQPNTLLGRPIAYSDSMPTIAATKKTIAFGDFSQYEIKDTLGMQIAVLDQLYAENGQVGFKGNERTDGKLMLTEAVKLLVQKA